jgi:hypothetical protein
MADITMCINHKCVDRENCYRYRAVPGHWQAYTHFERSKTKDGLECFWSIGLLKVKPLEGIENE